MKNLFIPFLILLMFACTEQQNKVTVLENYEAEYNTENEVDKEPGNEEQINKLIDDLKKITNENVQETNKPVKVIFNFKIYINSNGSVDAVMPEPVPDSKNNENVITGNDWVKEIAQAAEEWKFTPAAKNGKQVNYAGDIGIILNIDKDGKISEEIPPLSSMAKSLSTLSRSLENPNFDSGSYYMNVDEQPTPVGGMISIQKKITYPEKAKQAGIQGRVFIKAYLNENGKVEFAEVLKGIGAGCDSVALKAVKETEFMPGKLKGKPVKTQVAIPIVFKLQ